VEDDGNPHGLAPSAFVSFVLEFFDEEMKFGGVLWQVGAQYPVL